MGGIIMANAPILKKRDRSHSVAIFKDEYTTNQGEIRNRFSVAVQRSYKDKNGEWKQTALNCFIEDLLPLALLLQETYSAFNRYLESNRPQKTPADPNKDFQTYKQTNTDVFDDDIPF